MPRQIEGNDSITAGDIGIVQERAVLPPVGTCRVQAKQRNALPRLLEIDAMRLTVEVEPQVAADDRLDGRRAHRCDWLRRRGWPERREELLQEQEVAAPDQHVAFDLEMPHPLHADQALKADRWRGLGELGPASR